MNRPQTVELTSKKWKGMQLIGMIIGVAGMVGCVIEYGDGPVLLSCLGGALWVGLLVSVVG